MSAAVAARRVTGGGGRTRPGSLVSPVVRHSLIFAGTALAAYAASAELGIAAGQTTWLLAGAAVGVIAALIAMGWLGLPFMTVGAVAGLLLEYHLRLGPTPQAAHQLVDNAGLYLAALATAAVAYLIGGALIILLGRRR